MQVYLIDPNRDFQKANPKLKFNATEKYHLHYYEWRCVYSENGSVFCWFVLVGKQSLLTNTICDSDSKDGYNAIIRIGNGYQDFSRENEFQLTMTNPTVEGIKAILNRKSVIAPNLTNYEVFNRLQKIKSVCGELRTTMKIHGGNLDYVEEFLQLEDKTFEESLSLLVRNKLKVLSNSMAAKPKSDYEKALENMGYISRCLEENQSLHEKVKELNCKYESLKGTTNKFIDEIDRLNVLLAEERRSKNEPK
ncbi:MAG: hypothetical protein CMM93_04360 [Rickettsiales bacterium]|nr:hypothetical protein [Rickettsiales bacterium]